MDIVKYIIQFLFNSLTEILVTVCSTYVLTKINNKDKKKNHAARKVDDGSHSDS